MSEDPLALPQPRPRRGLWITLAIIAITIIGSILFRYSQWKKWEAEWKRLGPIDPVGGGNPAHVITGSRCRRAFVIRRPRPARLVS